MPASGPEAVLAVDAPAELARLGLDQHLSSQRSQAGCARWSRASGRSRKAPSRRLEIPWQLPSKTLLADRGWILADGATGTNLFNMGLASGEAPELWNEDRARQIRGPPSTGRSTPAPTSSSPTASAAPSAASSCTRPRVASASSTHAARIAREAAEAAGWPVVVAGSMGPTGELSRRSVRSRRGAARHLRRAGRGLPAGGVDLLWVETMSAPDDCRRSRRHGKAGVPVRT